MKKNKSILGNIAFWCHLLLAVTILMVIAILTLASLGFSPEGLGMGIFLLFYSLLIPGFIVAFTAIIFTLLSFSKNLQLPTILLFLLIASLEFEESTSISIVISFAYVISVFWIWKIRAKTNKRKNLIESSSNSEI